MLKLCRDTHGDGEIVMAYPGDVYTGHGNDGFQILESFYRFQKKNYNRLFICLCKELCSARLVEIVCYTERNATPAERRIFQLRDNFFRLGGHSLAALKIAFQSQQEFHVDFPLQMFVQYPVLSEQAKRLEEMMVEQADASVLEQLLGEVIKNREFA